MTVLFALAALGLPTSVRPLVFAHYMPWYESKPVSGHWGWHWTMNHFNPDRGEAASRFRPLIGLYDSSDPDALECQALQMKLSGIDGVFIDWYGTKDLNDYALLNRNTQKMIDACSKVGLKFSLVMEDQIVPQLVKAGKTTPDEFATSALDWLNAKWFKLPGYLRWNGKPVLLMFGPQYYKDQDLIRLFGEGLAFFTLLGKRGPAVGGFGWPEPQVGDAKSWVQLRSFYDRSKQWSASVPVAYPRFADIYKAAGVGPGYGEILDRGGKTFTDSLDLAMGSRAPFVQIATWNDWGEGTQIEPSVEFGYRDLEAVSRVSGSRFKTGDLRLPARLYSLRKRFVADRRLDRAADLLRAGRVGDAGRAMDRVER